MGCAHSTERPGLPCSTFEFVLKEFVLKGVFSARQSICDRYNKRVDHLIAELVEMSMRMSKQTTVADKVRAESWGRRRNHVLAASYLLPTHRRSAFLAEVARELGRWPVRGRCHAASRRRGL
jgi:hypothetical protein